METPTTYGILRISVRARFKRLVEHEVGRSLPEGGVAEFDYYGFTMLADEWRRMGEPKEITISVQPWAED